jgi:hypothetical protein
MGHRVTRRVARGIAYAGVFRADEQGLRPI